MLISLKFKIICNLYAIKSYNIKKMHLSTWIHIAKCSGAELT